MLFRSRQPFFASLVALGLFCQARPAAAMDLQGFLAAVVGYVLSRTVHDTGQGLAATAFGWKVTSFRPYPTTCETTAGPGGTTQKSLALSCVTYRPIDDIDFTDPGEIKRFHREDAAIIASGALANHVFMLGAAPLAHSFLGGKGLGARIMGSLLSTQFMDFPLTATLGGLGATTEWTRVAEEKGFQKSYLIGAGIADYVLMGLYLEKYGYHVSYFTRNDPPLRSSEPPLPAYAWSPQIYDRGQAGAEATGYGATARFAF